MGEYDPVAHQETIERFRQCEDPDMFVTAKKQMAVVIDNLLAQTLINLRTGRGKTLEEQGLYKTEIELKNWTPEGKIAKS